MPSEDRNLADVTLLQGLDPDTRAALEGQCAWRRYRPGERVFERGSAGREVFFVIHGALNVVSVSPLGREITFAAARSGGIVGEMAAIDGQPRSASVVAVEESMVAILPSEAFIALLESHGEIALQLHRQLSAFVRQSGNRVLELSAVKAINRVYGELLRLAEPEGAAPEGAAPDLWAIKPLPALRDLASQADTTREVVTSALSKLYPSGLIRRKGNSLYILDRQALEEIVKAAGGTAED
jgi:CRP-like cAMP-binding protein